MNMTIRCQFCQAWNHIDGRRAESGAKCGKCAKPILIDRPIHLDDETFARTVADSEAPVLVDFYADWCGPCKAMAPAIDQLASDYKGRVLVAKLDTDRAQATAGSFGIRGIPTVIVFEHGKEVRRQSGAMPLTALIAMLGETSADHP